MILAWRHGQRRRRWRKWGAAALALVLLAGLGRGFLAELAQPTEPQPALALALLGKTIVIDAGHGGTRIAYSGNKFFFIDILDNGDI